MNMHAVLNEMIKNTQLWVHYLKAWREL